MPDICKTDVAVIISHLEALRDGMLAPLTSSSTKIANRIRMINNLITKLKTKLNDKK